MSSGIVITLAGLWLIFQTVQGGLVKRLLG